MVTGRVEQGIVKVGEEVEVVGLRTVWFLPMQDIVLLLLSN